MSFRYLVGKTQQAESSIFLLFQKKHGARNLSMDRHAGDLGNILTPSNRVTNLDFFDNVITLDLTEKNGIIGRAFVVHANKDDLGNFEKKNPKK